MNQKAITIITWSCFLFFLDLLRLCSSTDTITPTKPLRDGDVLVSSGSASFALGFFRPGNSTNRYVGIWYNKVSEQTVVWVANRDDPITSAFGVLSIDTAGNLVLHDQNKSLPVWSANVSAAIGVSGPGYARIMDSGNLVLYRQEGESAAVAWQSFDFPTDTHLPNMKLGVDRRTGLNRFLTSWRSSKDPGTGDYSFKMKTGGVPQFFLNRGSVQLWRTGPWNGIGWSGVPEMKSNFIFNVTFVDNQNEVYVVDIVRDSSIYSRMVVNESGSIERLTWNSGENKWVKYYWAPNGKCETFQQCGSYSDCDPYKLNGFECKCLPGYEPESARDWYLRDGSKGCMKKRGRNTCRNGEGFVPVERVKVPDTTMAHVDKSLGLKACESLCLNNCTCTAYASADISRGETGCITWYGDLIDIRQFSDWDQNVYIRVDPIELAQYSNNSKNKRTVIIVVVSVATVFFLLLSAAFCLRLKRKGKKEDSKLKIGFSNDRTSCDSASMGANVDVLFFDLRTMAAATDNFSLANKLGEGGFGSVYKGLLPNGQEVAVKRLSKTSGQGIEEFKNEVTLIARLQHRNLVRLLGCCVQHEEKMLVYEYLPNKGLDFFIFDKTKSSLLDWRKRFEIILGIARGMLYLHQDSRLRIIHRDLKASNVLLDATMDPKISDFGMARIFGGDQIQANTNRVVGTYGYMSPEYAMGGLFSTKSDVFSFGVLLLEIISGRKNNSYIEENFMNLIGHVWAMWKQEKSLEVIDCPALEESYNSQEILRCIHIGLLCVQDCASDRPTMSEVAFMLCHETSLPSPKQPAFIFKKDNAARNSTSSASICANSVNDLTITMVEAR